MASLRILIVEDEPLAAERLVRLCTLIAWVEVVGIAGGQQTALARIDDLRPDVLLLDISLPGLDGMAFARRIATRAWRPAVVFVTAHGCFAVEAFALAATDYLLKPVSRERLEQALGRVARTSGDRPTEPIRYLREIWAPRGRAMIRITIEALDLVEAERDYVRLHAGGASYLIRMTLRDLQSRLDPDRFLRVHRSSLIASDRVTALRTDHLDGWSLSLSSGHRVRVGRSFRAVVRSAVVGPTSTGFQTENRRAGYSELCPHLSQANGSGTDAAA